MKHVYFKFFFPTEVAVRPFSEKIGGIRFSMELALHVFSCPYLMILKAHLRTSCAWALFEIG